MKITALVFFLVMIPLTVRAADGGDFNWNLRTNPVGWVVGPNLRIDLRMSENWTAGAGGVFMDSKIKAVKLNGMTGGLIFGYNFSGALTPSWFVDFGAGYGDLRAEATALSGQVVKTHVYNISARGVAGYHWFWGHFNLALGAGVETNSAGNKDIQDQSGNKVESIPIRPVALATEASIGMAF